MLTGRRGSKQEGKPSNRKSLKDPPDQQVHLGFRGSPSFDAAGSDGQGFRAARIPCISRSGHDDMIARHVTSCDCGRCKSSFSPENAWVLGAGQQGWQCSPKLGQTKSC